MNYSKQLGIFVRDPVPGQVKTRLLPTLSPDEACAVYAAFLADLFMRVGKLRKAKTTIFYAGDSTTALETLKLGRFRLEPQRDGDLGRRMSGAFEFMLPANDPGAAVIIGSDSPDIPLPYIKRAFVKLKHQDVVLGPAVDGGYYLIGLKRPLPQVFEGIAWGESTVLEQTIDRIRSHNLSLSLLPVWYDVDTIESLVFLRTLLRARAIQRSDGLPNVSRVLAGIGGRIEIGS